MPKEAPDILPKERPARRNFQVPQALKGFRLWGLGFMV